MKNRVPPLNRQTGVVLVVSLVMLLLLTLIGLTGTQVTSLEERMASNSRDQNMAFQAAESTLLAAEQFVLAAPNTAVFYNGASGLLNFPPTFPTVDTQPEPDFFAANTWVDATSTSAAGYGANFVNNSGIAIVDPRYIIKRIDNNPGSGAGPETIFRITARAVGLNPGTQVILQENFVRTN